MLQNHHSIFEILFCYFADFLLVKFVFKKIFFSFFQNSKTFEIGETPEKSQSFLKERKTSKLVIKHQDWQP